MEMEQNDNSCERNIRKVVYSDSRTLFVKCRHVIVALTA